MHHGYDYYNQGSSSALATYPSQMLRKPVVRRQTWKEKLEFIRRSSPFGHLEGWNLKAFIVKSGDDLRKEVLAMQLVQLFQQILSSEGVDVYIRPYQIISTDRQAGLVEYVEGAQSLDRIKKSMPESPSLRAYFECQYGPSYTPMFSKALHNFVRSLAGYSLLTYVLQVSASRNELKNN